MCNCCYYLKRRPPTPTLFPYTTLFRSMSSSELQPKRLAPCTETLAASPIAISPPDRQRSRRGRARADGDRGGDRKSTRLNSSHVSMSYAVFCLKKKTDPRSTASSH